MVLNVVLNLVLNSISCMFYLCDLFFSFIFISMMINCIISSIQAHLFFCSFFGIFPIFVLDDNVNEEYEYFSVIVRVFPRIYLIFGQFYSGVAYKAVAYKQIACTVQFPLRASVGKVVAYSI